MKKLIICILLLLTSCFSLLASLFAEEKAVPLEEIVVTATRLEESVKESTSSMVVIKGDEMKRMNIEFITDVLRKIPELSLVQNGGAGKVAVVLLRGGKAAHTLVMIDGVKVNSSTTGSFDFSGVNTDDIERIEIVKGPQSTFYGSEAIAGVINIITKKGVGKPEVDLSFESGSYGTYKPSLTISGGNKEFDYRLTSSYFSTDGISSAKEGSEIDGYRNVYISGKFGIRPSEKIELELMGQYYYDRNELDDFDFFTRRAVDNLNFIQHGTHYLLSGKGKFYLFDIWEQILTLSTVSDSLKFRDPIVAVNNADISTRIDTIDWQHNFSLSDIYTLTAGAEYRKETGENKENFDKSIENKASYFNNKLKLFKEDLVLNAGLRYDDHETSKSKATYRIGAIYTIRPIVLRIKGSYGTGFRAPALNELFFPFYGNLNLEPEETTSWEIGLEKDFFSDRLFMSLIYFDQEYKNLIDTDPLTFTAENIAKAEVKGIEVTAGLKLSDNINVKAGYTYLDTEDKATGQRLSLRPKDKVNMSIEFNTKNISVITNYTFVGKRFDSSVARDLPSYSLVNLAGNYKVAKWLTVFGRIDNLFDEDYEEAGSYGTPGFSFFAGVKATL
ncbi:MAG TPA: TonB-dependent receptor [Thermodesulfovibrionales bacterium]|nr:TonB-dependent receptor [Thermodesulfovibrionales bacterium]